MRYRPVLHVILFLINNFEISIIFIFRTTLRSLFHLENMKIKVQSFGMPYNLVSFSKILWRYYLIIQLSSLLMKLNIIFVFINHFYFPRFSLAPAITSRGLRVGAGRRKMKNKVRFWRVIRRIEWREYDGVGGRDSYPDSSFAVASHLSPRWDSMITLHPILSGPHSLF